MVFDHITQFHLDALKEIGNIGAGHAATALSEILNKKITISIPNVRLETINQIINEIEGPESIVYSVCQYFSGDINGCIFIVFHKLAANHFLRSLFNIADFDISNPKYQSDGKSALSEFGNILSGNYLASFSDMVGLRFSLSAPIVIMDMISTIITEGLLMASVESDYGLIIDTILHGEKSQVDSEILFLPTYKSFHTIFSALGLNL